MSMKKIGTPLWERITPDRINIHKALEALRETEQALDDCNLRLVRHHLEEAQFRVATVYSNLEILIKDNGDVETYDGLYEMHDKAITCQNVERVTAECAASYRALVNKRAHEALDRDSAGE